MPKLKLSVVASVRIETKALGSAEPDLKSTLEALSPEKVIQLVILVIRILVFLKLIRIKVK